MTSPEKAEKTETRNKPKAPQLKRRREAPLANTRLVGAAACVDASSQGTLTRIVGIGASAGGLDALKRFFIAMPADSGLAFVLVLHLDPVHKSLVAELLSKHTGMIVLQVQEDTAVEANHVYVISPNTYLSIDGRVLRLSAPAERRGLRMPVDFFFRSLAADLQEAAVGIILSGTGSDGALGLREIKAAGGMTMVQDPNTAEHDGMPRSAVAAGGVDSSLPVEKMPDALLNYLRHVDNGHGSEGDAGDHLGQIVALLHAHAKFNFSCYKKGTLGRRIRRRMGLQHTGRIADYLDLLRRDPEEIERLWKDLLISVTSFFREPQAWQFLQEQVIPRLIERKDADAAVRVWVPGCATGEEAYSLAMLLIDQLRVTEKSCPIQIFASDVDTDALEFARAGVYPENIAIDVPEDRLRRFFVRGEHGYRVSNELREAVAFARQNLVSDPPFSKLDLISCRNLLIYIEPPAQQKIIGLLHFALAEGGYLFLGNAETIGGQDDLFETLSKKWRIYRRIGSTRRDRVQFPIVTASGRTHVPEPQRPVPARIATQAQQLLLARHAPACVVINRKLEIEYFHGPTQEYLAQPTGLPTQELLAQARGGLQIKLRTAIGQAIREDRRVTVSGVFIRRGKVSRRVRVAVEPLGASKEMEGLLLVSFEDELRTPAPQSAATGRAVDRKGPDKAAVRQLEDELKAVREDLRSTTGDLETSNEELKAANEEMMSANEELQSTNEELETSKEELQSLNEELTTVNAELAGKIGELADTCDDLDNLLVSTNIPTIFLDTQFCIKRFTPSATKLFNLIPSDVGRPMADITPRFEDGDLLSDARTVLNQPTPIDKEVQAHDGRWYIRQVLPYRARDNRVEGIVITFSDVAAEAVQEARLYAEAIVDTVREPLLVLDADLRVQSANQTFFQTFQLSKSGTEGRLLAELSNRQLEIFELQAQLRQILSEKKPLTDFAIKISFASGEPRDMLLNARCLSRRGNRSQLILLAFEDVTERNRTEEVLRESVERTRLMIDMANDAVITIDSEGVVSGWNQRAESIFGWPSQEIIGRSLVDTVIPPQYREAHQGGLKHFLATGEGPILNKTVEKIGMHRDGHEFPVELSAWQVPGAQTFTFSAFARDITDRKRTEAEIRHLHAERQRLAEEALHETEERFRATFEQAAVGFAHVAPDGRWVHVNQKLCDIFGYSREELLACTFQDITHPEDLATDLALM
ncbi:MAG: chemotaxis protein CheB [Candidatus Binatia bacterium]